MVEDDLPGTGPSRWPRFAPAGVAAGGLTAVRTLPLRVRQHRVGVMDLYPAVAVPVDEGTAATARSLADMAALGLVQTNRAVDAALPGTRLQDALRTRVVVERATGILAELHGVSPSAASAILRRTADRDGSWVADVARGVIAGTSRVDT